MLVADVLNSQRTGIGATWRINAKILSTCRGAEAYCIATRTACSAQVSEIDRLKDISYNRRIFVEVLVLRNNFVM